MSVSQLTFQAVPSASRKRWNHVREVFLPDVLQKNSSAQARPRQNWQLVREAFLDDTPPPSEPQNTDSDAGDPTAPKPKDASVEVTPAILDGRCAEARLSVETELMASAAPAVPQTNVPTETTTPVSWGLPEDVEALNKDIQQCLEIEGVESPARFFTESVEDFASVAHYYIHITKCLDSVAIDLYDSLASHLGEDHPLVMEMTALLDQEPQRTYLTREPTVAREERLTGARAVGVPGLPEYSEEMRSISWVRRTGPLIQRRHIQPNLETVEGSSVGGGTGKQSPGPIVCPGVTTSAEGEFTPLPKPVPVAPAKKETLWSRFVSCFCFAS